MSAPLFETRDLRVSAADAEILQMAMLEPEMGVLAITHCQRLLDHLTPDFVHILVDGRIVESGGMEVATRLEREGYESVKSA